MPDEPILREKARDAIRSGKVTMRSPDGLFTGLGMGSTCAVCGAPVKQGQMEIGIEFWRLDGFDLYHLHPRCFAVWELERTKGLQESDRT